MLAGTDDHLTWLSPIILNLESMGLTHLESEIRGQCCSHFFSLHMPLNHFRFTIILSLGIQDTIPIFKPTI